jgi:hypothetical protein
MRRYGIGEEDMQSGRRDGEMERGSMWRRVINSARGIGFGLNEHEHIPTHATTPPPTLTIPWLRFFFPSATNSLNNLVILPLNSGTFTPIDFRLPFTST